MTRAVFLDRDGVLSELVPRDGHRYAPLAFRDFALLPGVAEAVGRLKAHGLPVYVVTNQPDLARGHLAPADLERMHAVLRAAVPVDGIYVCPHDDPDACACRKPKPGLLEAAARQHGLALHASFFVGDTWRDMDAARAAGCAGILLDADDAPAIACTYHARTLSEAVDYILRHVR